MSLFSIYCASPLGFSESGRFFLYREILPALNRLECEVIDPWKLTDHQIMEEAASLEHGDARREALRRVNRLIGENNRLAIERTNLLFAVLDGTDVDSGTAAEIGYATALGKPVVGYRNDFRRTGENEEVMVHLQVQYFIERYGSLHRDLDSALGELSRLISLHRRSTHGTKDC